MNCAPSLMSTIVCLPPNQDWILRVKDYNICQQLSICFQAVCSLSYTDLNIFKTAIGEMSQKQMVSHFMRIGSLPGIVSHCLSLNK